MDNLQLLVYIKLLYGVIYHKASYPFMDHTPL